MIASRVLKFCLWLLAGSSALVLVALGLLSTQFGQSAALRIAASTSSSDQHRIQFGKLDGSILSDAKLDRVTVSDAKGEWLVIKNIALSWSPFQLTSGLLSVERASIDQIDVLRAPAETEASKADQATASPSNEPPPLLKVALKKFTISKLHIHEPVIGEPIVLTIAANANLVDPAKGLLANLRILRLNGVGGKVDANLTYKPTTQELDIRAKAAEPAGGIVSRMLEIETRPAMGLTLNGSGPLHRWLAKWTLSADQKPFANGSVSIDKTRHGYAFTTGLNGYLAHILPAPLPNILPGNTTAAITGVFTGNDGAAIHTIDVRSDALSITGRGAISLADGQGEGALDLRLRNQDGSPVQLGTQPDNPMSVGDLQANITLREHGHAQPVSIALKASGLALQDKAINTISLQATAKQRLQHSPLHLEDIDLRVGADGVSMTGGDANQPISIKARLTGSASPEDINVAFYANDIEGAAKASIRKGSIDAKADIRANLATLLANASGNASVQAAMRGTPADYRATVKISGSDILLNGTALNNPSAVFTGRGSDKGIQGTLQIAANVGQEALNASAELVATNDGAFALRDLDARLAQIALRGDIVRKTSEARPQGALNLNAPDLSILKVFTGKDVDGGLSAKVALSSNPDHAAIAFKAAAKALRYDGNTINNLNATGQFNAFDAKAIDGKAQVSIGHIHANGTTISNTNIRADGTGEQLALAINSKISGATAVIKGAVKPFGKTTAVKLTQAAISKGKLSARLAKPASITMQDGLVDLGTISVAVGSGTIAIKGTAGPEKINIGAGITALPADIANAFAPELQLSGTINGKATVTGTQSAPVAGLQAVWSDANAAPMRAAHLPPIRVSLDGELKGKAVKAQVGVTGASGLKLTAQSTLSTSPNAPLSGTVQGSLPLQLANAMLAERATQVSGTAQVSAKLGGTVQKPQVNGTVTVAGATADDPETGFKFSRIDAGVRFTEKRADIANAKLVSAKGGHLTLTGHAIYADPAAPVANIRADLTGLRFDDRQMMTGELNGHAQVTAPDGRMKATGNIQLSRLDVTVPNSMPASVTELDIEHVNAPPHLREDQKAKDKTKPQPGSPDSSTGMDIAIKVQAPQRIFVKGRGLDVQLGGTLYVNGSSTGPYANGAFTMERGRLSILGRQLDFKRGKIAFYNGLEPYLDMEAQGPAGDVTVIVKVTGSASNPKFAFSSSPQLPEDEVVARLLFNKDLAGLSPMQLAQLASEVDKIGGLSSGPSIVDKMKASVGIDVLDVGTDDKGGASVSAGSYVSEDTYVGVRQGTSSSSSRVVIDHNLTKNLKARGETGADGNSKLGLGFEWDY